MGLDMYLEKRIHVGDWHLNKLDEDIKVRTELRDQPATEFTVRKDKILALVEEAGYWRKANQIHKWFVDNVQDGNDDCKYYYVPKSKLKELYDLCLKAMQVKLKPQEQWQDELDEILPVQQGFFFGSYEYDDWYFGQIQDTIEILQNLGLPDDEEELGVSYYYSSSW